MRVTKAITGLMLIIVSSPSISATMEDAKSAEMRDDYVTAIRIYKSFADEGNTQAMERLAFFAEIGVGQKRDWLVAAQWLGKAFDAGDLSAANSLGYLGRQFRFMKNDCQPQALQIAVERLAKGGSAVAQMSLAVMLYPLNYDMPEADNAGNMKEAAIWYRRAAEQGDTDAQNALAVMSQYGFGVLQDYVQAHKWYNIAASQINDKDADIRSSIIMKRELLQRKMTPTQIQDAQAQAKAWKPTPEPWVGRKLP